MSQNAILRPEINEETHNHPWYNWLKIFWKMCWWSSRLIPHWKLYRNSTFNWSQFPHKNIIIRILSDSLLIFLSLENKEQRIGDYFWIQCHRSFSSSVHSTDIKWGSGHWTRMTMAEACFRGHWTIFVWIWRCVVDYIPPETSNHNPVLPSWQRQPDFDCLLSRNSILVSSDHKTQYQSKF